MSCFVSTYSRYNNMYRNVGSLPSQGSSLTDLIFNPTFAQKYCQREQNGSANKQYPAYSSNLDSGSSYNNIACSSPYSDFINRCNGNLATEPGSYRSSSDGFNAGKR
jgi:hypothetical protein